MAYSSLLNALATAILAGDPAVESIVERCTLMLGRPWPWLIPLARRYASTFTPRTRPRHRDLVLFLRYDEHFQTALDQHRQQIVVVRPLLISQLMQPAEAAANWKLPRIETVGDLADWLALTPTELEWFADLKALGYKNSNERLRHYRYRVLNKAYGNLRLIEAPKPRLKYLHQRILAGILDRVPPHPAAHGFVHSRSIKTFAAPHTGQRVVLRLDLQDFFPSLAGARIQTLFRTLGYPELVADLLGGICTNAAPRNVWTVPLPLHQTLLMYARPHLPQGAPTSPALANMCLYRADCRLTGLAESAGAQYTRYADDLAFSGGEDFDRRVERFAAHVAAILAEEGFAVHHRKTRIMRQSVRQHLAGIVANRHLNVRRHDFDALKATLTNCVRLGLATQNRESHADYRAHLEGRISFVEMVNPSKGNRLREIFRRILWP